MQQNERLKKDHREQQRVDLESGQDQKGSKGGAARKLSDWLISNLSAFAYNLESLYFLFFSFFLFKFRIFTFSTSFFQNFFFQVLNITFELVPFFYARNADVLFMH